MYDMDEIRSDFGTVADLSCWTGIKMEDKFRPMKFISKEKVIGEDEEQPNLAFDVKNNINKEDLIAPNVGVEIEKNNIPKRDVQKKNIKDIPAYQEASINPNELKNIAVRLLPSVDKVEEKDYADISQKAIDMAFIFLKVWDSKVSIGGKNG